MTVSVLIAWLASVLTYLLLTERGRRRAKALAIARLAGPRADHAVGERRPRLIAAADAARNRLTLRLMEAANIRQAAAELLESAGVKWSPAGLLQLTLTLFIAGFALVTLVMGNSRPLAAATAGAAAAALPIWRLRRAAHNRRSAFEEQFPDCLEFISRSMRAGHAFTVAIQMAHREFSEPLAGEFRRVFEEQNLGQPLDVALVKLSGRMRSMDVRFFVSAVLLQKRTGGNLAELLEKLALIIRERFKLRARIRAVSAQGLMSGRILSAIPLGVTVLMFVVNPSYARFFVDDPMGHTLAGAALGLQLLGYLIIKKIVTIEA